MTNGISTRRLSACILAGACFAALWTGSFGASADAAPIPGPDDEHHWCPGEEPVRTGNARTDPLNWDWNVCHSYWFVQPGQGNVSSMIWDGSDPPARPPSGPYFSPYVPPGWCMGLFLPSPCPE